MPKYKLTYFNLRARAEISRLIFALADQEYEEVRFEIDEWPTYKPHMLLGQAPILEIDDVKLPQSITIARYLAREFNLAGKNNLEQAKADAVVDTNVDIIIAITPPFQATDEEKKKELLEKFFTEDLPKQLRSLDILGKLYGNGGPFFLGDEITWADLMFYATSELYLGQRSTALDQYPWLQANRVAVEQQPRIAEYLKNRPPTPY